MHLNVHTGSVNALVIKQQEAFFGTGNGGALPDEECRQSKESYLLLRQRDGCVERAPIPGVSIGRSRLRRGCLSHRPRQPRRWWLQWQRVRLTSLTGFLCFDPLQRPPTVSCTDKKGPMKLNPKILTNFSLHAVVIYLDYGFFEKISQK
jgi:hypothetical protein